MTITHHVGPALEVVRTLPDASVDLVATSPPFWALRNYNDTPGQWGSEPTPAAFLDNLLELTVELRRVLAPHGSIAIELGDTYSGSGGHGGDYQAGGWRDGQTRFVGSARRDRERVPRQNNGLGAPPAKSLCGIPTLYAWSLAYGRHLLNPDHTLEPWRIRNIIVWARNNPPVGALGDKYRPATSYITVATPSARRWFDLDAVRTPTDRFDRGGRRGGNIEGTGGDATNWRNGETANNAGSNPAGAPPLDYWADEYDGDHTWLINTQGSSLAHYAMWPATLAQRLILSMCPPGGTVLDPFYGSGTTGAVADLHGRDAIGIDLDPANTDLHQRRYDEVKRALFDVKPPMAGTQTLF